MDKAADKVDDKYKASAWDIWGVLIYRLKECY